MGSEMCIRDSHYSDSRLIIPIQVKVLSHYHTFTLFLYLFICNAFYSGSWASHVNDRNQWIQVEFDRPFRVVAIQTQGRSDVEQWVSSYKLSYGNDGIDWSGFHDNDGTEQVIYNYFICHKGGNNNTLYFCNNINVHISFK